MVFFLNIAAGYAEGLGAKYVIPGFNVEEASTFPDNSQEYLRAVDLSLSFSTLNRVKTFCYSAPLNKTEIVRQGVQLGLPFEWLWPCYMAQTHWCGECESCQRFKRALAANGIDFQKLRSKK